ncbi:hypothetical protein [Nocardia bovistercoris]|uniref:Scaffolding protein n=1 Tax=Nocardia bovistercoris TaxID=2785916 RepID=A0A931IE34_9NOCA|nr:hypothetical protein [Nocardia bovistercoris]MBH0778816.1 hypothetical protein [Nocardia bovistercoris]
MSKSLPRHPDTGLLAIGETRRGPIWPVLGGSGDGDGNTGDAPPADGTDKPEGTDPGDTGSAGTGTDLGKGEAPADGSGARETGDDDAKVKEARAESARQAAAAKAAEKKLEEMRASVGKAFGFVDDDAKDPAKLTAKVAATAQEAREAKTELAVYKAAPKDVDVQGLLDSRAFARTLHELDPAAADFDQQLKEAVAAAVKANPRLKLTATPEPPKPPARSGADTGAGKGEPGQLTYEQYKALSPSERMKATKEGRANQILGRK